MRFMVLNYVYSIILLYALNIFSQINFVKKPIATDFILSKKIVVADIDRDGDFDVAGAANDTSTTNPVMVAWFENDGNEIFTQYNLDTNFPGARAIYAGDFDSSTNSLEIVAGNTSSDLVRLYEYDGSSWSYSSFGTIPPYNNYDLSGADINGDGNLDLLGTAFTINQPDGLVGWYQNDGSANFTERLIAGGLINPIGVQAGYINNDNNIDVVLINATNSTNNVRLYTNDGTPENGGWVQIDIAWNRDYPNGQDLIDINGDGNLDVVVAEYGGLSQPFLGRIAWWSNDGSGNFSFEADVETDLVQARCVKGADMDGDGDMDLVSAASLGEFPNTDGDISWYENDGSQNFTKRTITTTFDYAYWVVPVDLEGDGDMDLVASAQNANEISWWRNDLDDDQLIVGAGSGTFWNGNVTIDFSSSSGDSNIDRKYNRPCR